MKKSSWRTTLGGLIMAVGLALASGKIVNSPTWESWGSVIAAIGAAITGKSAADHDNLQ